MFLKQNTACEIIIGQTKPITDCVDGKTPIETLALDEITAAIYKGTTRSLITLTASGGDNDCVYAEDGYWKLTLTAGNVDTVGKFRVTLRDDDVFLPVSEVFEIISEDVYDSIFGSSALTNTDNLISSLKSATGFTYGGTWTYAELMQRLAAFWLGKWQTKTGTTDTYEILDPDNETTVVLEAIPSSTSPQKTVTVKI